MASNNNQPMIRHFADPHHQLWQTQYRHDESGLCNICLLKLAGHRSSSLTYGCYACNIHLHSACARHFQEIIPFFAHPAHTLKLRRSPGRVCDICRGDCPRESFVYSCTGCGFDVHPLCSMLPERITSPLDPEHQLCMLSSESPGSCSACHHPLPRWHYIGSSLKLHIACAAAGKGSNGHAHAPAVPAVHGAAGSYGSGAAVVQGSHDTDESQQRSLFGAPVTGPAPAGAYPYYYYYPYPGIHYQGYGHAAGMYCGHVMPSNGGYGASGCGQHHQSIFQNPSSSSMMSFVARFLFSTAISALTGDLLSELLSSASFS